MELNNTFLNKIIEQQEHDVYARIIALNNNEEPIDQIEGKITTGSINIDGDSTIRRTCSLTLINENTNINDFYWGIKTKFKLEIGLYNHLFEKYAIQNNYPEIVWFPQGYYVISSFNTSISTNNISISIQGKDKMSLLNGELGGQLFSSIDFGTEETIKEEMIATTQELYSNSSNAFNAYGYKYYIKCSRSVVVKNTETADEEFLYPKYIFIMKENDLKNEFANSDEFYTVDKKNYYRIGNSANGNTLPAGSIIYHIYEIITSPTKLYKEVGKNPSSYIKNKYYYTNNAISNNYFILDASNSATVGTTYYEPIIIYQRKIDINKEKIIIEKIIREAVHAYAGEPYHNIIIKDLNEYGLEKMTYKGDSTIYIIYNTATEEDENIFFGELKINNNQSIEDVFSETDYYNQLDGGGKYIYNDNGQYTTNNSTISTPYQVKKIIYGDDIGYQFTPLTYAGDLIANIGETLTSVLDKIKTMLGEFEYFYDLDGKFIFQKKKNYLQTSWSQLTLDEHSRPYIDFNNQKIAYEFSNNNLITALQNTPTISNIRNDFTVWGKRKGLSGADIPIHARYAVDKKPVYYQTLDKRIFYNNKQRENSLFLRAESDIDKFLKEANNINGYWWNFLSFINFLDSLNINIDKNKTPKSIFFSQQGIAANRISQFFPSPFIQNNIDNSINDIRFISITKEDEQYKINQASSNGGQVSIDSYYRTCKNSTNTKQYYIYIPSISILIINFVDWREIIYQMALDYFAGQGCSENNKVYLGEENQYLTNSDNFLYEVGRRNPNYYPTGYTGYEQYYTDLQGFWRQLYNPDYIPVINYSKSEYNENRQLKLSKVESITIDYYCNNNNSSMVNWKNILQSELENGENLDNFLDKNHYNEYIVDYLSDRLYWNKTVFEDPESLNFWFDFLDSEGTTDLGQLSVSLIGDRSKVIHEDKASSIIFKEVSNSIFINNDTSEEEKQKKINEFPGYSIINLPSEYLQYFTISTKSLSVKDKLDELLYQHTYCTENISITSIPIYHLQPNTRIFVKDDETGINGEYIVHKLTIPLTYNGTMSISASKAPERLY